MGTIYQRKKEGLDGGEDEDNEDDELDRFEELREAFDLDLPPDHDQDNDSDKTVDLDEEEPGEEGTGRGPVDPSGAPQRPSLPLSPQR